MALVTPSKEQADQFALMLRSGMPSEDAIRYFLPTDEAVSEGTISTWLNGFLQSPLVQKAILKLQGKAWQDMDLREAMEHAVNKQYHEAAYFLYSHNYCDLTGPERQKADTCRQVLEAKLAGTAGKLNALESWWDDLRTGKVKLPSLPVAQASDTGGPGSSPVNTGDGPTHH